LRIESSNETSGVINIHTWHSNNIADLEANRRIQRFKDGTSIARVHRAQDRLGILGVHRVSSMTNHAPIDVQTSHKGITNSRECDPHVEVQRFVGNSLRVRTVSSLVHHFDLESAHVPSHNRSKTLTPLAALGSLHKRDPWSCNELRPRFRPPNGANVSDADLPMTAQKSRVIGRRAALSNLANAA
jgi:hypothetical protein